MMVRLNCGVHSIQTGCGTVHISGASQHHILDSLDWTNEANALQGTARAIAVSIGGPLWAGLPEPLGGGDIMRH